MKPVDPRLLRHASAARGFLAASVLLGLCGAGLVIAQAVLIADIVVGAFEQGRSPASLGTELGLLAAVAVGRAAASWLTEVLAHRTSAAVKSDLRRKLLAHATALGPSWLNGRRSGELTTLATRGVDALDDYFSRYLPQLGLAVVVPVAVLARIVVSDWVSAVIIVCTIPLIPIFMILIGLATQKRMDRQWRTLARLSGHFLDVVAGLPTLKVFGRAKAQTESIKKITGDYRRATMKTLRVAFLSSFALELLATLSVALVAVTIGLRLVHGGLSLHTGLLVLVLAPEAYLPLRLVGERFHASAEGVSAAAEVFAVLETEAPARGRRPVPDLRTAEIRVEGVTVRRAGRAEPALDGAELTLRPGERVAVVGPSGAGKTTLLNALLGFVRPDEGRITVGGVPLEELDPAQWHARIAWVPQRARLFAGTVSENVRLARPEATDAEVAAALADAEASGFADALLGEGGAGLSAGQRQRVALARAFLADRPLVLLDEPTAGLDAESEAAVVAAVGRLSAGRTVLFVVHRSAMLAVADRVLRLTAGAVPPLPIAPGAPRGAIPQGAGAPAGAGPVPVQSAAAGSGAQTAADGARPATAPGGVPGLGPADGEHDGALLKNAARPVRGRLSLAAVLGALTAICSIGLLATSGWLISRASQHPPVLYLMVAVTAVRAFGLGRGCFRYAERLASHDAVFRILADLRVSVYRRLERLAPAGLPAFRRGDLLSRLVADVDALQDHFLRWLLPAAVAAVVAVATAAAVGVMLPAAGVVLLLGLALAGVAVPALAARAAGRAERGVAPAKGRLSTEVVDVLSAVDELTVSGALPRRLARADEADAELTRLAAASSSTAGLGSGLITLLTVLTCAATGALGVAAVHSGAMGGLLLAVVMLTPLAAFEVVSGLPLAAQHRQRSRRAAQRVEELSTDGAGAADVPAEPAADAARPAPASPFPLRAEGLTVRYASAAAGATALRGLDLELTPGRRIAVVGPSGSGKTTLAHALLRFVAPAEGRITLAGVDAAAVPSDEVRRLVGLCAQDAHLFASSIRENLRLARPGCGDDELRAALAKARLLEWVDGLPDGLDTLVGEHGALVSGGQRQRIALARALLADFPVLLLDEPAEHLDLATADAVMRDLLAATGGAGRATVVITHRLAALADADVDEVLVLDRGAVVQRGPWSELIAAEGPLRSLWERETDADRLAGAALLADSP
ncbi:ABC transporter [Mangrovactinospora gilvigrisea]|uniref:ABC transporter n=1 Tax=Mangrovactinospora gilvigrisea TaxID=1428644 RepID=A0A1J7BIR7_9ACTN|nr:thiol reductant ABC exporter subunit CydD [Mangrovactinospora gilvigrisea]OIV38477.1 ABC transporter [Mangrovactinospora gilvigrisea]